MQVKLKVAMAGDEFAYKPDDLVDTAWFVSKSVDEKGFLVREVVSKSGEVFVERVLDEKGKPIKPLNATQIADLWVEALIAELPKSEDVLAHDVERAEIERDQALVSAEDAGRQRDEIAKERDELVARVELMEEAATDDAAAANLKLTARVSELQKQLDEKDTTLGNVRKTVTDELRPVIEAEVAAKFEADLETARKQLDEATKKLAEATAAAKT